MFNTNGYTARLRYWYNVVCFYNQSNSHPSLTRVTTSVRNGLGLYRCAHASLSLVRRVCLFDCLMTRHKLPICIA